MSERLVEIRDLSVEFSGVPAVSAVSLHIDRGETVALVGESGSGKSVTALSILQLLPYPAARHPSGSIRIDGTEMVGAPSETLRRIRGNRITMVFQEPMTSLNPLHSIERQIGEMLYVHRDLRRAAARAHTLELLKLVGLREAEQRMDAYPHELSGGQRQRVMIAMALANEPDLLIADEPTTALDVTIQAQILELLRDLQARLGMALLLITHDLTIVRKLASRVYVMQRGEIVEQGAAERIFSQPQHAYTRHLLECEPAPKPLAPPSRDAVIECRELRVHFPIKRGMFRSRGVIRAVDGVSLRVGEGRTLGVVGESGSGKTTLGMALLRLIRSEGEIRLAGRRIDGESARALRPLRRAMQIVFQDPYGSLSPRLSVRQIIEEGLLVHEPALTPAGRRDRAAEALEEVGIGADALERYPHEFSGGQRQRIAVARAMVLRPRFVVLDEPTSALDMTIQAQLVELLRELQARHRLAYLFISHDLRVVRALADDVMVLRDGRVVESGRAHEVFDAPKSDYTRALIKAAYELESDEGAVRQ